MANLNERNQQILGLLSLMNGPASSLLSSTTRMLGSAKKQEFVTQSDGARVSIRQYGIEKPSLTYVAMSVPKIFQRGATSSIADLQSKIVSFRAERVSQPGVQMVTSGIRRYGVGPIEKKPVTAAFNDINVSFIGDAQGIVHQFFYAWMNGIIRFDDSPSGAGNYDQFDKMPFEVEYKNEYRTTLAIIMYDEVQTKIGTIKLHNAFPTAVGEIQRDWAGVNDLVRINVSFTFSHWSYDGEILGLTEPTREVPASKFSMFGSILQGMTALQAITAVKRPQSVNDILSVVNTGSTLIRSFLPRTIDY